MKTNGQILYEFRNPSHIQVVRVKRKHFTQPGDIFTIPNPNAPVPWRLLSEGCKQIWEIFAKGHYFFSSESDHG